ncbi:hypothetical protein ACIBK8_33040 [Streptomyces sp. NPDC050161]|uniref:hypothetical protein n=1 Tax=Streptomyces sp. NPDC050161 TaxID=3365604 RepID=UPI00378A4B3C
MVAVDVATATELLRRPVSSQDQAVRRLVHSLSRSLAADGISNDLIVILDEVLSDRPAPTAEHGHKVDDLLVRLGLPLPRRRRRPGATTPLPPEEVARITDRFHRATRQLMQVVPHRVTTYPAEELRHLLALRHIEPAPAEALPYLRRYALAIVTLLDLMGDDA